MSEAEQPVLVVLEHDRDQVKPASLRAISAARSAGRCVLAALHRAGEWNRSRRAWLNLALRRCTWPIMKHLTDPIADRYAKVVADVADEGSDRGRCLAASSTFSRDLLPRVAALLDCADAQRCDANTIAGRSKQSISGR